MMKIIKKLFIIIIVSIIFVGCGNKEKDLISSSSSSTKDLISSEQNKPNDIWSLIEGYWTNENFEFVYFLSEDTRQIMNFGLWYSGGGRKPGYVQKITKREKSIYEITVRFPYQEETLIDGPYEEEIIDVTIDVRDLGKKIIYLVNENNEIIYNYSGKTSNEALIDIEK